MEACNLKSFAPLSFHLLLFFFILFTSNPALISSSTEPLEDGACTNVNCGQGTCEATNTFPGFDCVCNPGWKKLQIGPFVFPSCLLPNCTVDLQCGNGAPPPPPPPAPLIPPPVNSSDPCNLVWCGEGTCTGKEGGLGHVCQCNAGSANLFNNTDFACFKECSLGGDCNNLEIGKPPSPPPPTSSAPPGNGSTVNVANSSMKVRAITVLLLAASFLAWL